MITHPAGAVCGGAGGGDEVWAAGAVGSLKHLFDEARLSGVQLTARTFEHELRNVLAVALGYADLLAADESLPQEARRRAQRIRESTAAAVGVMQQLAEALTPEALAEVHWGADHGSTLRVTREPALVSPAHPWSEAGELSAVDRRDVRRLARTGRH